jgi:HAD superfamily hydrolase (TIGR01509 family)
MIFDMDGVLIDSMPLHVLAWERYLQKLGIFVEGLERRMHGKRNSELVSDLIAADLPDDVIFRHGADKEQLFRDMLLEKELSHAQISGLIDFLERHRGTPMAVGSNAEPENIEFILERLGLHSYFPVTVNGMQVERPKPFPDIYLEAARRLGVAPENCIVFEDSPTGVQAGRAAGMRVVGVETTPTQFEGIALRIKDFTDPVLEPWLQVQGLGAAELSSLTPAPATR